jgi:hypothetical protein
MLVNQGVTYVTELDPLCALCELCGKKLIYAPSD